MLQAGAQPNGSEDKECVPMLEQHIHPGLHTLLHIFCVISGSRGAHCWIRRFLGHADARFFEKDHRFFDQHLNYVRRGFMPGPQYASS
jgi:hypothetical protein